MKALAKIYLVMFCITGLTLAIPMDITYEDLPEQDPLKVPNFVHELGNSTIFPLDEAIYASYATTDRTACAEYPYDDPDRYHDY